MSSFVPQGDAWGAQVNAGGFSISPFAPAADQWGGNGEAAKPFTFDDVPSNFDGDGDHAGDGIGMGDASAGGDSSCRNCGQEGHFSRECLEPKKMTGECFNCGEVGHNKAECTNPKVDRPFDGTCRICNETGHRGSDCPQKPADFCKNCREEGHKTWECINRRVFDYTSPKMKPDEAWAALVKADNARDTKRFQELLWEYGRALNVGSVSLVDIEESLRESKAKHFLIALDVEVPKGKTCVDIQGQPNRKYSVRVDLKFGPRRKIFAAEYPKTREENLKRLEDAGFILDSYVTYCDRCGEAGHPIKYCKQEREPVSRPARACANCGSEEHNTRRCTEERRKPGGMACRNCGREGHKASECEEPQNMDLVTCRVCEETGHMSRDCPNKKVECRNCLQEGHYASECTEERAIKCRNCDEIGHMSRQCPKPTDWSRVVCRNCGQNGHGPKRCPEPLQEGVMVGGVGMRSMDGDMGMGTGMGMSGDAGFDNMGGGQEFSFDDGNGVVSLSPVPGQLPTFGSGGFKTANDAGRW